MVKRLTTAFLCLLLVFAMLTVFSSPVSAKDNFVEAEAYVEAGSGEAKEQNIAGANGPASCSASAHAENNGRANAKSEAAAEDESLALADAVATALNGSTATATSTAVAR